jgi:hypothetical protein
LTDIQRWACDTGDFNGDGDWLYEDIGGKYVTFADHVAAMEDMKVRAYNDGRIYEGGLNVAAVAAARAEERNEWANDLEGRLPDEFDRGYEQGVKAAFGGLSEEEYQRRIIVKNFDAGVKAARDAVAAMPWLYPEERREVLAVIDALEKP